MADIPDWARDTQTAASAGVPAWAIDTPQQAQVQPSSLLRDWGSDAAHVAGGIANMVLHPVDTAEGVWDLTKGLASKGMRASGLTNAIAGMGQTPEQASLNRDIEAQKGQSREKLLDAAVAQKVKDYGSLDAAGSTALHKPFSTAMDLSAVLMPASAAKNAPGLLGQAAGVAGKVGEVVNPLYAPIKGAAAGINALRRSPDPAALGRQVLGETFDVPLSRAQISGTASALGKEDQLAHGGRGGRAQQIMQDAREQQGTALEDAGQTLRTQMSGAEVPLSPTQIGEQVSSAYRDARAAAKQNVTGFYDMAFDPELLAARGIPVAVPLETVAGLPNALEHAFVHSEQYGGALIPTRSSTPNTYSAIQMLRRFSQEGAIPSAFPKVTNPRVAARAGEMPGVGEGPAVPTEIGWQGVDMVRKQLVGLARGVNPQNATDLAGMRRVISAFDEHFGAANPMLNEARLKYRQYADVFEPQRNNAAGVNAPLRALQNSNNPGQTIYNSLFEGAPLKRGEAGPLIGRLQEMFQQTPEAMQAVKEGALQRILNDPKTHEALSPQKAATKINEALNGPQGEIYKALFSPEELYRLSQYGDLSQLVARTTRRQNASGSSYPLMRLMNKHRPEVIGAMAGGALGATMGPVGAAVGAPLGGAIGHGVDTLLAARAARVAQTAPQLVRPPASYGVPSSPAVAGLLASRDAQRRKGLLSP